jgi:hypothetical protein
MSLEVRYLLQYCVQQSPVTKEALLARALTRAHSCDSQADTLKLAFHLAKEPFTEGTDKRKHNQW